LDLRDGTEESRNLFGQKIKEHLAKSSFFGKTVTFGLFIESPHAQNSYYAAKEIYIRYLG
jgi:hypothetical protein